MPLRWDDAALTRKEQIEGGLDLTFSAVFAPYYLNLLAKLKPNSILEVGGGTGHLAEILANIPARYVMLEPSPGMYKVASELLASTAVELHNTKLEDYETDREYDLVISHMCIQTVLDIT